MIKKTEEVTILILIDGFLQYELNVYKEVHEKCHNPYFNRWFSAISLKVAYTYTHNKVTILILIDGFLQWFKRHRHIYKKIVTIIILIDGFLQ